MFYKYQQIMRDHVQKVEETEYVRLIKSQLVSFEQLNETPLSRNEKILISEAFKTSITQSMTVITADLIKFAKKCCFDLRISNT